MGLLMYYKYAMIEEQAQGNLLGQEQENEKLHRQENGRTRSSSPKPNRKNQEGLDR
jgi:hypothetical protein